jgi:hypothetical protein
MTLYTIRDWAENYESADRSATPPQPTKDEVKSIVRLFSYSGNLTLAQCDEVHALFVKLGKKAA